MVARRAALTRGWPEPAAPRTPGWPERAAFGSPEPAAFGLREPAAPWTGLAGTGGAADAGLAGTGGVRIVGTGGAGAGGRIGTGGAPGIGGANGGTGGATGTDASVLICQDQEICSGENCQTACDTSGKTTFCTCVPAGGNTMQLSCATFSCDRDAGATDARPAFSACPANVTNQPDCDLMTDTVCATTCANRLQTQCVCVPHGGGGNGRWMCGSPAACE